MTDQFKNKAIVVLDGEHKGWPAQHRPIPFAFGLCVVAWDAASARFAVRREFDFKVHVHQAGDGHPDQAEFWKLFPDVYKQLSSEPLASASYAGSLLRGHIMHIHHTLSEIGGLKIVLGMDDPNDLIMADVLLEESCHGESLRRLCSPVKGHCSVYDLKAWLEGRDHGLQATADILREDLRPNAAGSVRDRQSKYATTEHKHTHDPLDDALHLAETFCWALNNDAYWREDASKSRCQ